MLAVAAGMIKKLLGSGSMVLSTILLSLASSSRSSGAINLREASYTHTALDLETSDGIAIRRHYNSRSARAGLVGYGWCLDIEANLKRISEQRWNLYECGPGAEIKRFAPDRTGEGWIALDGERLKNENGDLVRKKSDGIIDRFDAETGRLKTRTHPNGQVARIKYDSLGRPSEIAARNSRSTLEYDALTSFVARIRTKGQSAIVYRYRGRDLIQVEPAEGGDWRFTYDDLHNLTRVQSGTKILEELLYDRDRDRVIGHRQNPGCGEAYSYSEDGDRLTQRFSAGVEARCPAGTSKSRFEFQYQITAGDSRSLTRMKIETAAGATEFAFDPVTGRPSLIEKNKGLR